MKILICNVGSTSLKYQLFQMDDGEKVICAGGAERVGAAKSLFYHQNAGGEKISCDAVFPTHREAISAMLEAMLKGCISSLEEVSSLLWVSLVLLDSSFSSFDDVFSDVVSELVILLFSDVTEEVFSFEQPARLMINAIAMAAAKIHNIDY